MHIEQLLQFFSSRSVCLSFFFSYVYKYNMYHHFFQIKIIPLYSPILCNFRVHYLVSTKNTSGILYTHTTE